jgi:hypothetical protein
LRISATAIALPDRELERSTGPAKAGRSRVVTGEQPRDKDGTRREDAMTTLKTALGIATLGLLAGACNQIQDDASGAPPLTDVERAVVANMEKGTLAEIALANGKMRFIEVEPGMVVIVREFPVGVAAPQVDGEDEMTLEQIFRAYAPNRQVPQTIFDAMRRGEIAAREATPETGPAVVEPQFFSGQALPDKLDSLGNDLERKTSALTNQEFARKCSYSFVDWSWCHAPGFQGAWAKHKNHRGGALDCGTGGSSRMQFFVSGALKSSFDVPFQQCVSTTYHGPHGFLGSNLDRTMEWRIVFAQSEVGFTGWTVSDDGFVILGWSL